MKIDRDRASTKRSRPNLTVDQAHEMLGRLDKSKKTLEAFALQEQVSTQCLRYWKTKLRGASQAALDAPSFIQILPASDSAQRPIAVAPRHPAPFVWRTSDGCQLSIPADASEDSLRRVLRALKEER